MPLNRKNRITNKKKNLFNKIIYVQPMPDAAKPIYDRLPEEENKNNSGAGCTCRKCGNYNEYAEANQPDGSFVCFSCKNY